ncbi:MAG: hypothetical protein H2050_15605 [Sphingobium sp.]|uniref:hypothetical protein n=1 Tax=unclassified Sphingobium TaxID=2611147 RepID=UPI0011A6C187|nr:MULTISPECIES: hypothetical protein [unclassified Sphingobium]MBA4756251.1 hypothetical protein [Sphingobium sp.]
MGAPAHQVTFNTPPFTFTRDEALRYTGLAPKMFDHLEQAGSITGRRFGRNGATVYLREQLEKVTANLFGAVSTDIDDEFEGIGG